MKIWTVISTFFLSAVLPMQVLASEPSYHHMFKTTYEDTGMVQEGALDIGQSINCLHSSLPDDELDYGYDGERETNARDSMIYCDDPVSAMTALNHQEKTYQIIDKAMIAAMQAQRNQMMRKFGIEPVSSRENKMFQAFGDAMGKVKQKQRENMGKAILEEEMTPEERKKALADLDKRYPKSQARGSMRISAKVSDLHKEGKANGIPCHWYRIQLSGILNKVTRLCGADWSLLPGGQRTRELIYAFMNFMKDMSQDRGAKHNIYDVMQEIDKFRLISITEDDNGNLISTEKYQGTKEAQVSYTAPKGYTEEDMGRMMGQDRRSSRRPINVPDMNQTDTTPTQQEAQSHDDEQSIHTERPRENPEDVKKKFGDLLKGMGIDNLGNLLEK